MEIVRFEKKAVSVYWSREPKNLYVAQVDLSDSTLILSQFEDETDWYADACFGKDGYPYFSHGQGARSTYKHVARGALKALLDARKSSSDRPVTAV